MTSSPRVKANPALSGQPEREPPASGRIARRSARPTHEYHHRSSDSRRTGASTRRAKEQLQGMSKDAIIQYSALLTSPFMLQLLPGAMGRVRPAFNLVISNVPGPEEPLYFRGARLEEEVAALRRELDARRGEVA